MMSPLPSNKNCPKTNTKNFFNEKDQIKFERIMSTRNVIKQRIAEKYMTSDTKKIINSTAKKNINNVRKS